EGRVTVNGHRIDGLPAWVDPVKDHIKFDGRRIKAPERDVYVMLFKPKGYVSTNSDPERRPLAVDLVQHPSHARLYPVGRLDIDGSGLLLMTNDGALRCTRAMRSWSADALKIQISLGLSAASLRRPSRDMSPIALPNQSW
ncbi:rRNA pseudouridine synthase, partial [bacterium]|nr:rRNA pseudouridine synthase [bacterium]